MRIAIVGAGITGLTAAAALTAAGLDCDVYEQAEQFAEVGAGLQLAPNATRVLRHLGLDLRPIAVRAEAIEMRRWADGTVLRRTPLGSACEDEFGAPYYTVHRADLHAGLLGLLSPGRVHTGRRCVQISQDAHGVGLRFADGSAASADVLIGADGIRSVVRALLSEDRPRFSGHSIYRGLVPASRVPWLPDDPQVTLWLGPGRHCVCYPVRGGELFSVGATSPAPGWREESWMAQGSRDELLTAYAGWDERVTGLLAALPAVTQWALHDRDDVASWSRGPIALAGDAAHPMLPFLAQGANQGIEDAIVLATVLRDADPADAGPALTQYELLRRERVGEVHRVSRRNTDMLHLPDGPDQRGRDQHLAAQADLRSQGWLYGYQAERAAVPVPHTA